MVGKVRKMATKINNNWSFACDTPQRSMLEIEPKWFAANLTNYYNGRFQIGQSVVRWRIDIVQCKLWKYIGFYSVSFHISYFWIFQKEIHIGTDKMKIPIPHCHEGDNHTRWEAWKSFAHWPRHWTALHHRFHPYLQRPNRKISLTSKW